MGDSCGSSGTGETPQAFTPRRLTARTKESEHLEGKSTTTHYLVNSNKVCENSQEIKELVKKEFFQRVLCLCISLNLLMMLKKISKPFSFNKYYNLID